jgi:hypothetical protein
MYDSAIAVNRKFFRWRWTVEQRLIAEQQKQLAEQQVIQLEQKNSS